MMKGLNPNGNLQNNVIQKCNGGLVLQRNKDLDMNRSGSAPPTVEGALRSAGNLFRNPNFVQFEDSGSNMNNSDSIGVLTEEEIRSHPAYLEYYYSNENLNPRLPPPLLSKEDWRVAQRFRAAGGTGDRGNESLMDNGGNSSLFSMQPDLSVKKAEDELMELRKAALRNISRKSPADLMDKSFSNIVQDSLGQHVKSNLSRPSSRNSVGDVLDSTGTFYTNGEVQNMQESFEAMLPIKALLGSIDTENVASALPSSFASVKLSSSETELVRRSTSPSLGNKAHPGNNKNFVTSDASNFTSSAIFNGADITASLSGLSMSSGQFDTGDMLKSLHQIGLPGAHQQNQQHQYFDKSRTEKLVNNYGDLTRKNGQTRSLNISNSLINESTGFPRTPSMKILQSQLNPSEFTYLEDLKIEHQRDLFPGAHFSFHMHNGCAANGKADMITSNDFAAGSHLTGPTVKGHNQRNNNQIGIHYPGMDPHHIQYHHGRNMAYISGNSPEGICVNNLYDTENMQALERAYLETLLVQQNQQYQSHLLHTFNRNNLYHGNPAYVPYAAQYQESRMLNPLHTKISPKCSMFQHEKTSQFSLALRRMNGESAGLLHPPSGKVMNAGCESLLEAVKNNKSTLELLDVLNYAVEFSMDQYGSRFIQQKLETATIEERMKIFKEIFPHARTLMVDVFGNYVVQKFFEHGTDSQRKELAGLVIGHVLPLSLQMYGCRVIQKALEVVDVELQTVMVAELEGSVMKCLRDQNGNHVIQKCIECIPQNQIQSIILSFLGQIVTLSMHPYGCRVVQRVLEHCDDPKTQQIIMDEIMSSVYKLAQDRYGNYVIQHVLQHGKPHERTAIISRLAGQIVKMSQQKFASNVVEKCLTFGGPEERKILVNEMLGSTAENEPLQAMMKDPFGNYVVQKVLETCDEKSRELVMSRIKVHLNALKRYTYGKHIITSVEKLVATGERRTSEMIQV